MMKNIFIAICFIFFITACKQNTSNSRREFSFAFLTDIHVQPERNAEKGFRQAIARVNSLHPDFVLTGGDLIMDALEQKQSRADSLFELYLSCVKDFTMPLHNTMGNHEVFGLYTASGIQTDHPLYGKKMYEKYIGKPYYSFNYKGWHFMVLDGIGFTPEREYYGWIDSVQLDWIKRDLTTIDSATPICVSTHIPMLSVLPQLEEGPFTTPWRGTVIGNTPEVLSLFDHFKLKLVLQGHLHFLEFIRVENTTFITGGAVCSRWWQGKTKGLEEGFVMFDVFGDSLDWRYVDYGWEVK